MNQKSGGRRAVISVCGCLLVQVCVGIIYLWSVLKGSVAERLGMSAGADKAEMLKIIGSVAAVE